MRIEAAIDVAARPERVWEIATDPTLAGRWNSNIMAVRDVQGTPISAGSTWTQVIRILGRPAEMKATVVECDPPNHGVVSFTGPGYPRVTTTISSLSDGARLTQIMDISADGGLGGVAARLARPVIERELKEALRRQKEAAEGGEPAKSGMGGT